MKKLWTLALALALVLTCIPALSEEEPMTIRWSFSARSAHENFDTSAGVYALIAEKFNVDIQPVVTNYLQNQEQFNMLLAAGDVPDVWYCWNVMQWYDQGMLRSVDRAMFEEHAPNLYENALLADIVGTAYAKRVAADGHLVGYPIFGIGSTGFMRYYRQEQLDAMGIGVPATVDEFENFLRLYRGTDFDGNGALDSYGLSCPSNKLFLADFFGAYGMPANGGYMLNAEGAVVRAEGTAQFREMLGKLSGWFAEGLIDPNAMVVAQNDWLQQFANGSNGTIFHYANWMDPNNTASAYSVVKATDADARIVLGDPLIGPGGDMGTYSFTNDADWTLVFGAQASDELVAKVLEILEWANSAEGFIPGHYVEGGYEITELGAIATLLTDEQAYTVGQMSIPLALSADTVEYSFGTGEYAAIMKHGMEVSIHVDLLKGFTLVKNKEAGIGQDIGTVIDTFYWNCILGITDVEADWDAYIAELEANGLRALEAEAQEIYDTYIK